MALRSRAAASLARGLPARAARATNGAAVAPSSSSRLLSSSSSSQAGGVPAATMQNVVNLAANLRSGADVENMLLTYGVRNAHIPSSVRPLAVVKVGGEVITKDIDNLVSSLKFLKDFGLFPVVVHGGGPQLNDELAKAGVKPEYIGGAFLFTC
jgi:hypothetical protein